MMSITILTNNVTLTLTKVITLMKVYRWPIGADNCWDQSRFSVRANRNCSQLLLPFSQSINRGLFFKLVSFIISTILIRNLDKSCFKYGRVSLENRLSLIANRRLSLAIRTSLVGNCDYACYHSTTVCCLYILSKIETKRTKSSLQDFVLTTNLFWKTLTIL